jgi:hypothetical protein
MADQSSGRDPQTNSGSDSGHHYKGTAHNQYHATEKTGQATPNNSQHPNGAVGNGKPGKPAEDSAVK